MNKHIKKINRYLKWLLTISSLIILTCTYALLDVVYSDTLLSLSLSTLVLYVIAYVFYRFYSQILNVVWQLQTSLNIPAILSETIINTQNSTDKIKELDILYGVFKQWPYPVAIFGFENKLVFFNQAMYDSLASPLYRGMTFTECGFIQQGKKCNHPELNNEWKVESFSLASNHLSLVTASYIRYQLQTVKRESQQDLIRILAHELNNSITPITSLADSILTSDNMPEAQVNNALERIRSRSEKLLNFIQAYVKLNKLPTPKAQSFNLKELAQQNAIEQGIVLIFQGETLCFADPMLFEQLIINVFKNAKEAKQEDCEVTVTKTSVGKNQLINIQDNGTGFYNLNNALTPLYTTKKQGQGLGLSLCNEIIQAHFGELNITNTKVGALLSITLPSY